ncbi:tyrosine- kinase Tec isoform X2, partial [Paramuricea clavata]
MIPPSMRQEMVNKIHKAHHGANSSIRRAREALFWPAPGFDYRCLLYQGDDLTVLQSEGGYWWLAKDKDGRTGYIPANGVRHKGVLGTEVWFVGDIMRHVAEEMLLKEGQNFVALYSFNGQDSGDLSFVKGDEFTILEHAGDGWYLAKDKYGRTGYVPGNFLLQKSVLATEVAHISATARHGNQVKNERSNDFKELHHEIG